MIDLKPFLTLYQKLGFTVIPAVYGEKRPSIDWKRYQEKGPKESQVKKWFKDQQRNIAVLCGRPSGNLVVLDFDDVEVYPKFFGKHEDLEKQTLVAHTGSGKPHVYLKSDKPVPSFKIPQLKLEIRSDGNVVIAPPSKHPSGGFYSFVNPEVKNIQGVTDLVSSVWAKAEALGVKTPSNLFDEEAEEWQGEPYEGPDPPCILTLSKGLEEGIRNEAAMRLLSYWLKFKQDVDPAKAFRRLKRWNSLNKPPLPESELKTLFESSKKLDRSYGCRVNQAWCDIDQCTLVRNKLLRKEAEDEAEKILSSPNVLNSLKPHLDNVLVGEDDNKKLEFILLLSGKIVDPTIKQMILLKSEPGAGKSHLMRLADAFKTKSVGRFSAHALDYSDLQDYEVLKLKELGSMDQEFQGVSTVKFLSADDQGYTVEVTERDENGRFGTKQYRVPPITVVTSTTRVVLDPQFERRSWILNPDESQRQTNRIRAWKSRLERERNMVKLGLLKETSQDHSMRLLRAIVKKLNPCNVLLPFPGALTKILGAEKLRLRGDYDKFFALVKLYGVLNQRTLPIIKGANSYETGLVLPQHAFEVLKIAEKPYISMATELEERSRRLIDTLKKFELGKGSVIDVDTRGKIAVELGLSERTVHSYLKEWAKAGYMSATRTTTKGRPTEFTLLYDLSDIKKKTGVTLNFKQIAEDRRSEFEKEAESFLDRLRKKISYGKGWTEQKVKDALKIENTQPSENFFRRESKQGLNVSPENNVTTSAISTTAKVKGLDSEKKESPIIKIFLLDEPYKGNCPLCDQRRVLYHQIEKANGEWGHACQDCGEALKQTLKGDIF